LKPLVTMSLLADRLFAGNRLTPRAFSPTSVGVGALPAHRQPTAMPHAAVASDLDQAFDVHGNLSTEITF
jgi:hypothetical protein